MGAGYFCILTLVQDYTVGNFKRARKKSNSNPFCFGPVSEGEGIQADAHLLELFWHFIGRYVKVVFLIITTIYVNNGYVHVTHE